MMYKVYKMSIDEAGVYCADKLVGKHLGKQFAQRCTESFSKTEHKWDIETEESEQYWKKENYYFYSTEHCYLLFGPIGTIRTIRVDAPDGIVKAVDIFGPEVFDQDYLFGEDSDSGAVKFSVVNGLCDIVLK